MVSSESSSIFSIFTCPIKGANVCVAGEVGCCVWCRLGAQQSVCDVECCVHDIYICIYVIQRSMRLDSFISYE